MKNLIEKIGGNSDAGILDGDLSLASLAASGQPNLAALFRIFGGIIEEVSNSLSETGQIAVQMHRFGRHRNRELVPVGIDDRAGGFDGAANDGRQLDEFLAELNLATVNARDIQQIIHEPNQLLDL